MYIIDPFYVYVIEQLRSVNFVICILTFISVIGIIVTVVSHEEQSEKKEKSFSENMGYYIRQMKSELECIKENTERISNSLNPKSDVLGEYNKARIDNLVERVTDKIPDIDSHLDSVNKIVKAYNEKTDMKPYIKFFLCMFIVCIISIAAVPTRESAYRILFSSMITVERVTEAGQITTDVANSIVDKITESIIKIQEAKR